MVHTRLEGGSCVSQHKGNEYKLIVPIMIYEHCFVDFLLSDLVLMIPKLKIDLREVECTMKLIYQIIDPRYRVSILDCLLIKIRVVDAHIHHSILLPHQYH